MPRQRKRRIAPKQSFKTSFTTACSAIWVLFNDALFNTNRLPRLSVCMLFLEIILCLYIIREVKYTEIDWQAYMQQVEGFLNGTLDYTQLRGDTGPLVYPAGFLYIFTVLYYVTNRGTDILCAQYIYFGLYLLTLYLLYRIYRATKIVPPYVLLITCCISYRIHSVYLLRLFNDPVAVCLLYASINAFLSNYWTIGSVLYSLAVSVKMNILLYSPALLVAYLKVLGLKQTIKQLSFCALVQLLLGYPFLLSNPIGYVSSSFNIGRIFLYKWTVNWRFLNEDIFLDRSFHISLLIIHIVLLLTFLRHWCTFYQDYASVLYSNSTERKLFEQMGIVQSRYFVEPLFVCNFIGVMCSRSLHYQFYAWYYHTLPFLLWRTNFSDTARLTILGIIELCWNTYPSTVLSSAALHVCHLVILYGLLCNRPSLIENKKNK